MEKIGIPTVNFVTEWFVSLAHATSKAAGMPEHNLIVLPRNLEALPESEIIAAADKVFDEIVAALTSNALVRVTGRKS